MKKLGLMILTLIMVLAMASCGDKNVDTKSEKAETSAVEEQTKQDGEVDGEDGQEEVTEEAKEDERVEATDFILPDKDGNDIRLSDYKGKVIFVNIYATWCGYCVKEMPLFEQLMEEYPDDLAIVLVDAFETEKKSEEEVYSWYDDLGYSMPMGVDSEGLVSQIYPVGGGFPTTYIIDKDFRVVGYFPGAMDEKIAKGFIDGILAE